MIDRFNDLQKQGFMRSAYKDTFEVNGKTFTSKSAALKWAKSVLINFEIRNKRTWEVFRYHGGKLVS